ncbi:MAG: hypothetical protein PHU24_05025 [Sphaerochaetaceae bacterium]|jgi:hypothetical protein|nr:hypothetical protein [Sphaerochaetaceae bacterium]MDD2405800.1 hypothetical protein [Sphaerochaetaceae bacterium]MDD4258349.1 hypothetical protein [Sphaerochaetaceae bacterium]MDD4840982.1 hypothetical protein [Sphaerochaetaceae bacterium]NLO59701.1 hypothetical protein [Spirochaetales bacterium]
MKKRLVLVVLALALVPTVAFSGVFDFGVGATAQFTNNFDVSNTGSFDWAQLGKFENYGFGADIRTRLLFAEIDIVGLYSQAPHPTTQETLHSISGLVTGGISLDLLGLLRIGVGLGPRIYALIDSDGNTSVWNQNGSLDATTNFGEAFMKAPMTYRATVDFKLGNILLGVNYTVDSDGFTFEDMNTAKLAPKFAEGKLGASVVFVLF